MRKQIDLEALPEEVQREVLDYAEFLLQKRKKKDETQEDRKWLSSVKRGPSKGTTASATVEAMREEERC